ncbi:MAG: Cell surface protein [Polyangiaceae bacterium]|nr:Cell surface protein [Polyangiaceae bacterium]
MFNKRYTALCFCLFSSTQVSLLGCSAEDTEHGPKAAASTLVLADAARCEPGRFESTVANACTRAEDPIGYQAGEVGGVPARALGLGLAYGVRLNGSGGVFTGEANLNTLSGGEHIIYLSAPNIDIEVLDAAGAVVSPTCGRYLPLAPTTPAYSAGCTLRGAYAISLHAQANYRLRFSSSSSSYVRVMVALRRDAGVTATSAVQCGQNADLLATLAPACSAAEPTTAVTAAPFGGTSSPPISGGVSYGVRLGPVGDANEGSVTFSPPYTADYVVYTGTAGAPVGVLNADGQVPNRCGYPITDENSQSMIGTTCTKLRAGYVFKRLKGGVAHQLELGQVSPQSWVRTIVLPTAPDTDADGLADNLDRCPTTTGDPETCGCAPAVCSGGATWLRTIDDSRIDTVRDVVTDASGNVYTIGEVEAFETVTNISVRKFDSSGTPIWSRTFDYSDSMDGRGIAMTPTGDIVVAGSYYNSGNIDLFTAKLSSSGALIWESRLDTGSWGAGKDVAVDPSGNIYFVGSSTNFDLGLAEYPIIRKFDPAGNVLWTKTLTVADGASSSGVVNGVSTDSSGDVVVVGFHSRAFTAKYDGAGNELWSRIDTTGTVSDLQDVAVDSNDNIAVVGSRRVGTNVDVLVRRLTPIGSTHWEEVYDGGGSDFGLAIAAGDTIAVTGSTRVGTNSDLLVQVFAQNGILLSSQKPASAEDVRGEGAAFDLEGNLLIGATGVNSPAEGGLNGLLLKYVP